MEPTANNPQSAFPPPGGQPPLGTNSAWQPATPQPQNQNPANAGFSQPATPTPPTGSENTSPPPPPPAPVESATPPPVTPKRGGKTKWIILIIIILLLAAGAAAAYFYMSSTTQDDTTDGITQQTPQAMCSNVAYTLSEDGVVSLTNNSSTEFIDSQEVTVYIDTQAAPPIVAPQVGPGETVEIGTVSIPQGIGYEWEIVDANGCSATGSVISDIVAQCINIRIFDEEGVELTPVELTQLQSGDTIILRVGATALEGTIDAAKFIINGVEQAEVTTTDPLSGEYMDTYTIPDGITSFTVEAELMHSTYGWF